MTDFERQVGCPQTILLPEVGDFADAFWLNPEAIERAGRLINRTHLSTMALGVETHRDEAVPAHTELHNIFIEPDEPLVDELRRAIDVGFMYGALIAQWSADPAKSYTRPQQGLPEDQALPEHLRRSFKLIADTHSAQLHIEDNAGRIFTALREVELAYANSDILAFSLTMTQKHIADEFAQNHEGAPHVAADTVRLQSLYYAGALAGALLLSDSSRLDKTEICMMASSDPQPLSTSMLREFSSSEDLVRAIDQSLTTKLDIRREMSAPDNAPVLAILPSDAHIGPNRLLQPLHVAGVIEPPDAIRFKIDDTMKLFVERPGPEPATQKHLSCIDKPASYLSREQGEDKIVGLLVDDKECIATYDTAHPYGQALLQLVQSAQGQNSRIKYTTQVGTNPKTQPKAPSLVKRWALLSAGSVAPIWAIDIARTQLESTQNMNWSVDVTATAIFMSALGCLLYATREIATTAEEHQADSDAMMLGHIARSLGRLVIGEDKVDAPPHEDAL